MEKAISIPWAVLMEPALTTASQWQVRLPAMFCIRKQVRKWSLWLMQETANTLCNWLMESISVPQDQEQTIIWKRLLIITPIKKNGQSLLLTIKQRYKRLLRTGIQFVTIVAILYSHVMPKMIKQLSLSMQDRLTIAAMFPATTQRSACRRPVR